MKQNISTEATLVLLNTLLNEAGVSARQHYETTLPRRSLCRNRRGKAKGKRRDAFRFHTAKVPGMPADSDATPEGRSELEYALGVFKRVYHGPTRGDMTARG